MTVKAEDKKLFAACLKCSEWLDAFLKLSPEPNQANNVLSSTQDQVKLSISIINEALDAYR
jgi:hypothetical protein